MRTKKADRITRADSGMSGSRQQKPQRTEALLLDRGVLVTPLHGSTLNSTHEPGVKASYFSEHSRSRARAATNHQQVVTDRFLPMRYPTGHWANPSFAWQIVTRRVRQARTRHQTVHGQRPASPENPAASLDQSAGPRMASQVRRVLHYRVRPRTR
jgi:hypothetical protein